MPERSDLAVIGGGIVGLATARALQASLPGARVTVLEKEPMVATHQTGRNSGVAHAGIYYPPGSDKARLCRDGVVRLKAYCRERGIAYHEVGKLVTAVDETELPRLQELWRRGRDNGVPDLTMLDAAELREIEPHAAGLRAIHSPTTAIVDFAAVARSLAADLQTDGGRLLTGAAVRFIQETDDGVLLRTDALTLHASAFVNCAGLHADRLARAAGAPVALRIVPFRGEYRTLAPARAGTVRGMIYPVPDPAFPFLGVHLTRTLDGRVEVGPNAVLALAREGYGPLQVEGRDVWETLQFEGFRRLALRHWRAGAYEVARSASLILFARAAARLVPSLRPSDLRPGPVGVRAQAVRPDGTLVDDFAFVRHGRGLHVLNAPSPAATASLAIGREIAERLVTTVPLAARA